MVRTTRRRIPGQLTAQGEANDALVEERTYILEVRTGGLVEMQGASVASLRRLFIGVGMASLHPIAAGAPSAQRSI